MVGGYLGYVFLSADSLGHPDRGLVETISVPYVTAVVLFTGVNAVASTVCWALYNEGERMGCRRVMCWTVVNVCVRFAFVLLLGRGFELLVYITFLFYRNEIQAGYGDTEYKFPFFLFS